MVLSTKTARIESEDMAPVGEPAPLQKKPRLSAELTSPPSATIGGSNRGAHTDEAGFAAEHQLLALASTSIAHIGGSSDTLKKFRSDGKKHVAKGSLTEQGLLEEKMKLNAMASQNTGDPDHVATDDDVKREQRRAANRLSAFQSRQRRKIIIDDLQKTVSTMSAENASLRKDKELLNAQMSVMSKELESLREEVLNLRKQHGQISQPQGAQGAAAAALLVAALPGLASLLPPSSSRPFGNSMSLNPSMNAVRPSPLFDQLLQQDNLARSALASMAQPPEPQPIPSSPPLAKPASTANNGLSREKLLLVEFLLRQIQQNGQSNVGEMR